MRPTMIARVAVLVLGVACATHRARPGAARSAAPPDTSTAAAMPMRGPHGAMGRRGMMGMRGMQASASLGDSIFHGTAAGGTCFSCHGPDAKGTALAPNLTDAMWLNGDGSFPFIVRTVMHGVAHPKRYPGAMPAMGGARLTMEQMHAVAAYVYGLSHPAP